MTSSLCTNHKLKVCLKLGTRLKLGAAYIQWCLRLLYGNKNPFSAQWWYISYSLKANPVLQCNVCRCRSSAGHFRLFVGNALSLTRRRGGAELWQPTTLEELIRNITTERKFLRTYWKSTNCIWPILPSFHFATGDLTPRRNSQAMPQYKCRKNRQCQRLHLRVGVQNCFGQ